MSRVSALARLVRTAVHLRPIQIYWRLRNRLVCIRPDLAPAPELRAPNGLWQRSIAGPVSMIALDRFRFLNVEHRISAAGDWNDPERDRLWMYNLHYFADLTATEAAARADWHRRLIARWVAENPSGHGVGWEPFCLSLRIVNWLKWHCQGGELDASARDSLAVQVRHLMRSIEWHLLGNHVFENARALVFAGLCFQGAEAQEWLKTGRRLLEAQLSEQILVDGGHFERSPMYHALVLEGVLDLLNLAAGRMADLGLESLHIHLADIARRMLVWLKAMVHPDGEIALFNDAAFEIAPKLADIVAYAARLGIAAPDPSAGLHLSDSGYVSIRTSAMTLIADVGDLGPDYQPGHGHADTLSFELSLHGHRVIVDAGTSCYGMSPERLALRRTAAHNTLVVDGQDSSEVWSGFRVGRRAHIHDVVFASVEQDGWKFGASHDGYRYLTGRPQHRREWVVERDRLKVFDTVKGGGEHDVAMGLLLHPDCRITRTDGDILEISDARDEYKSLCSIRFAGYETFELQAADYHPQFGKVFPSTRIVLTRRGHLPLELSTCIEWSVSDKMANSCTSSF